MEDLLDVSRQLSVWFANGNGTQSVSATLEKNQPFRNLVQRIRSQLHSCAVVYTPPHPLPSFPSPPPQTLKAVAWNIDRGKRFDSLVGVLKNHPELASADLYFLTEVDWGMARSGNRNVAADLGRELGCFAYFAPSHFNFTKGYQSERNLPGANEIGLFGMAILSRAPLEGLRVVTLPNGKEKLGSREARIGGEHALIGELPWGGKRLTLACTHLEAFSSPVGRAHQLKAVVTSFNGSGPVLVAGDWNTNTLDSSSGPGLFTSIVGQLLRRGPRAMLDFYLPYPERHYDRLLFEMLEEAGFGFEEVNDLGVGTYNFSSMNGDLRKMISDEYPRWTVRFIRWIGENIPCHIRLKLDWFAARDLRSLERRVVALRPGEDYPKEEPPSDHLPIRLSFQPT